MWLTYILYQYISSFRRLPIYHILFSPVYTRWSFRLWRWNVTFLDTEIKELGEAPSIILTTQDRWSVPSSMSKTLLQTKEAFMVKEYKHTHTHTHTHTRNNLLSQRTPHAETNILPIISPLSDIDKSFTNIIHKNWQTIWLPKPLSAYIKSSRIHNHSQPSSPLRTNIWFIVT